MNKSEKGVISFKGYEVRYVKFVLNDTYDESDVTIDMQIGAEVNVNNDTQDMLIDLELLIFKDARDNNYPFEMRLILRGYFSIESEPYEKLDKFKANAMAILFPYARALVSTYTASANVSPLILPTVNINKLLDNAKKSQ